MDFNFDSANGGVYDPFSILNKANVSSGNWWQQTLQNSRNLYDNEQRAFNDSFDRAKKYELFPSDLEAARNQNKYNALYYQDKGQMLENGLSDANLQARFDKQNYDYQMPSAMLHGRDIQADAPNKMEGTRAAYDFMKQNYADTPGIRGLYGNNLQGMNNGAQLDSAIAMNDVLGANKVLADAGLHGTTIARDQSGNYIITTPQGSSQPMSADQARNYLSTRMGGVDKTPFSTAGTELAKEQRTNQYRLNNDHSEERAVVQQLSNLDRQLADKDVLNDPILKQKYLDERANVQRRLDSIRSGNRQPYSAPSATPSNSTAERVMNGANLSGNGSTPSSAVSAATAPRNGGGATPSPSNANTAPAQAQPVARDLSPQAIAKNFNGWQAKPAGKSWFGDQEYIVIDPRGNRLSGSDFQERYGFLPQLLPNR